MAAERSLSIALASFDRHVPFFMDWLTPAPGFRLKALDVSINTPARDGGERHRRMFQGEFDIAELSLGSYVMAKARGSEFTAVPVFPRRLFSQNHIYVRTNSPFRTPQDLLGRRVAIRAFQVTLSILAKGDLKSEYQVPWEDLNWVVEEKEIVAWSPKKRVSIEPMPEGAKGADLLLSGAVDAYMDPRPPGWVLSGKNGIRNLFDDQRAECERYYKRRESFPIMHLLAIRPGLTEEFPHLPAYLISAWEESKNKVRAQYQDLAYSMMPFGRMAYDDDEQRFGGDVWKSGLRSNRKNLEWFIDYMVDQTLLEQPIAVEELFHPSVLDS